MKKIKKFTYDDYIKYRETTFELRENDEKYKLEKGIHQYKDKGFKIILEEKREVVHLINKALEIENTQYAISKEDIIKYNSSFITESFKAQEADIVYKKKEEDVFFLIEQQSQVDYSMAYRILNYCIEIIRSAVDKKKLKSKGYKMPVVYPIVLYTGKKKWDAKTYFEESQMKMTGVQKNNFTSYNLIDINDYIDEELWGKEYFLSKIILLEKARQNDKMKEYIERIGKEKLKDEEISILVKFLYSSLDTKIEEEELQKFAEQIIKNRKEGNGYMLTALEEYFSSLLDEGLKNGMKRGIKKGIQEGMEKGIQEGMEKGMQEGMEKGIQEGMEKGIQEGMEKGMQEGMEKGIQEGMEKGIQEGIEKGRQEGIQKGKETGKLEILKQTVKNMLQFGEKDETIMKYMGIEKEELENIKGMI